MARNELPRGAAPSGPTRRDDAITTGEYLDAAPKRNHGAEPRTRPRLWVDEASPDAGVDDETRR